MNINWLVVLVLISGIALFELGMRLGKRPLSAPLRLLFADVAILLCLPALSMVLYYTHWFPKLFETVWYYELRAIPFSELTAALAGLGAGFIASMWPTQRRALRMAGLAGLTALLVIPHSKPVIGPVPQSTFSDTWSGDVCIQSTPSSCGLASAATVLRSVGVTVTEAELAKECHTWEGGTEAWYLVRAFRRRGVEAHFAFAPWPDGQMPKRGIAGVQFGGMGHFVAILPSDDGVVVGDPIHGALSLDAATKETGYRFTGFFLEVTE